MVLVDTERLEVLMNRGNERERKREREKERENIGIKVKGREGIRDKD